MKREFFSFALFLALAATAHAANPAPSATADDILKATAKNLHSNDESVRVKMTITEANGSQKERNLQISRIENDKDQSVLVRLLSPADLRGTGLLSVTHVAQADQWLYLPSSKQTRRILSGKRGANFLDSELSYEDMGNTANTQIANQILRTETGADGPVAVIESKVTGAESAYSRILTWVPLKSHLASKIEYYDRAGALLKTTDMTDYQQYAGGVWRARRIVVANAQNHRGTQLDITDLKLNMGLSSQDFTPSALGNP
jgi:uncharacterized protein